MLHLFDRLKDWFREPKAPAQIAGRLRKACQLIRRSDHHVFSTAVFAEALGMQTVSDFESRLTGKVEADFAWIVRFTETFGVNAEWIKSGIGQPFATTLALLGDPRRYQELIEMLQPQEIYFVRSSGPVGEITMVFGWAEKKYLVAADMWHLSDCVGSGGARSIVEFYEFLRNMETTFRMTLRPKGHVVAPGVFDDLIEGRVYPRTVLIGKEAPWWDDFIDIEHRWPIAKNYEKQWGPGFTFAQGIVRHALAKKTSMPAPE